AQSTGGQRQRGPRLLAALGQSLRRCLAALDRLLELAPRSELGDGRRRDRHLLRRVPRIHALPLGAPLRREFAETPQRHFTPAAPQCVGGRGGEGVDGPRRVTAGEARLVGDLVDELLFGQVPLLLSTVQTTGKNPNSRVGSAQPCGFAGVLAASRRSLAPKIGRSRTPFSASAAAPPSSRSTTQTALRTTRPASRSASTASRSAPPEVTTSSTRHTISPSS